MITVTVELRSARTGKRTHLGSALISNDGTGTMTQGNYEVVLSQRGDPTKIWKCVSVRGFPRKRLLMWDLLYRALREAVGERNS